MSSTNRGSERIEFDAYYTDERLASKLVGVLQCRGLSRVLEPHAGGGAFVRAFLAAGYDVTAGDINPEAPGLREPRLAVEPCSAFVGDFLTYEPPYGTVFDIVAGNPPYTDFEKHVDRALELAPNVAFLLRLAVTESASRIESWRRWPLRKVWVLAERPSFTGGKTDSAAYGFFWFQRGYQGEAGLVPGWSWKEPKRARRALS